RRDRRERADGARTDADRARGARDRAGPRGERRAQQGGPGDLHPAVAGDGDDRAHQRGALDRAAGRRGGAQRLSPRPRGPRGHYSPSPCPSVPHILLTAAHRTTGRDVVVHPQQPSQYVAPPRRRGVRRAVSGVVGRIANAIGLVVMPRVAGPLTMFVTAIGAVELEPLDADGGTIQSSAWSVYTLAVP